MHSKKLDHSSLFRKLLVKLYLQPSCLKRVIRFRPFFINAILMCSSLYGAERTITDNLDFYFKVPCLSFPSSLSFLGGQQLNMTKRSSFDKPKHYRGQFHRQQVTPHMMHLRNFRWDYFRKKPAFSKWIFYLQSWDQRMYNAEYKEDLDPSYYAQTECLFQPFSPHSTLLPLTTYQTQAPW